MSRLLKISHFCDSTLASRERVDSKVFVFDGPPPALKPVAGT